jgi:ribosomal-protein-alanine N-acetyltransferase
MIMTGSYIIRPMEEIDIPQAIDIDREAFPTQWPHPTYASYKHELHNRLAHYIVLSRMNAADVTQIDEVVKQDQTIWVKLQKLKQMLLYRHPAEQPDPPSREPIIGVAGVWMMADEAHIITIGIRNACRRQGLGEFLLIATIDMTMQLNASLLTLEVRVSNIPAQELYKKYGFKESGLRRHYYSDNGEDALIMTTDSITSHSFVSQLQQLRYEHRGRWKELYEG